MAAIPIPVVILGGSDRQPSRLPDRGEGKHPLTGYKGLDVLIDGEPLVEIIAARLRDCGAFGPLYVSGPARVYKGRLPSGVELIDTDGSFGENIRVATERIRADNPGRAIAYTTCDILPRTEELRTLMEHYSRHAPCDVWYALIRMPDRERLGASDWKPSYRVVPRAGEAAVSVLPGHLFICDTDAIRLDFIYRLFEIGYGTRNQPIAKRRMQMLRGTLASLLGHDLRGLGGLRWPRRTWNVLTAGLITAGKLRRGEATLEVLEAASRRLFCHSGHRRRYPHRRVFLPVTDAMSIALDIDTEEEAREAGGDFSSRSA